MNKYAKLGVFILIVAIAIACDQMIEAKRKASTTKKILYVTESKGFKHSVLPESEKIMKELGSKNGFDVIVTQDSASFMNPEALKNIDVIVFYTTGELPYSAEQKKLFLDFIKSGKGFVGVHSATDTFFEWLEFGDMIGGYFDGHPWTSKDTVTVDAFDRKSPITKHWEKSFSITEEIYQHKDFKADQVTVTMKLDTSKTDMTKKGIKHKEFPISWYRNYGKGRVFYTSFGHNSAVWNDQRFQTMIVNALKWASKN